ncbi:MAG: methionyl-tRNA formyltransferase [Myxococcota bacterium]
MRIIFFGTPDIAVPTLERLIAGPHDVVGVVSQPDRARGRGRKTSPSPVAAVALREEIPLLRPEKVGEAETVAELARWNADLGVVVAFGQFLPKKVRELPSKGYLINAHASLLPKYRGAAPIARVIMDSEAETGISVMRIEREMDAGPVAAVVRTPIAPQENTAELSARLSKLAADAIADAVDVIARDEVLWTEQDPDAVTYAEKVEKADAILDLREPARALAGRIHALSPKPGGTITLADGTALKISRADVAAFKPSASAPPGTIERDAEDGTPLRIATGDGWLLPLVVQKPGGKALPVEDFLRGFALSAESGPCKIVPRENAADERKTKGDDAAASVKS